MPSLTRVQSGFVEAQGALQEAIAKIETLEAKVTALKNS